MGIMTLLQFQDDLKDASGRPNIDAGRLNRIINNAQYEFAYAFKFHELENTGSILTVQGTNNYVLPSGFRMMTDNGVSITSPQERYGGILELETRTNFLRSRSYPDTSSQGAVGYYHLFGKKIWVRPTPDGTNSTIDFDYWGEAPALVANGDVTVFNPEWDDVLFRGALLRIHMVYGEHDRMVNIYNMYLGLLRSRVLAEDLEEFPEGGISYVQSQYDQLIR